MTPSSGSARNCSGAVATNSLRRTSLAGYRWRDALVFALSGVFVGVVVVFGAGSDERFGPVAEGVSGGCGDRGLGGCVVIGDVPAGFLAEQVVVLAQCMTVADAGGAVDEPALGV